MDALIKRLAVGGGLDLPAFESKPQSVPAATVRRAPTLAQSTKALGQGEQIHARAVSEGAPRSEDPDAEEMDHRAAREQLVREALSVAREQGHKEGMEAGRAEGRAELEAAIAHIKSLHESIECSTAAFLQENENLIAAIVFEAVCKIIGSGFVSPDGCLSAVRHVVAATNARDIVSIGVSPRDFELLSSDHAGELYGDLKALPVESDASVELGGCVLKLKQGELDARIETQFRLFAQSLKDAARNR